MRHAILTAALALAASGCTSFQPAGDPPAAVIHISANGREDWTIAYRLPAPATELVFARSPDDSRGREWRAADGFVFAVTGDGEVLRRTDGAPFQSVAVSAPPVYRPLPKDYGPFSPFGDGGMLVHSGRFFACGGPCSDSASWSVSLKAPRGERILLDGVSRSGIARWTDRDSGRNLYVGRAAPVEGPDFVAVIDEALPQEIRAQLAEQFPRFMHGFAEELGAPEQRPMLFLSYDLSHPGGGWGRQGGVLPGQVFMHFYGSIWPEEMKKPGFVDDLAAHFAHEAAHIFQRQIFSMDDGGAWIHEGSADAFAMMALRADGRAGYADRKIETARADCAKTTAGRSVRETIAAGAFEAAYSCGLLINLEIDNGLKAAGVTDGLYALWRTWIEDVGRGTDKTAATYYAAIGRLGGEALAQRIKAQAEAPLSSQAP